MPMHLAGAMWRTDAVLAVGGWTATVGGSDIGLMLGVDADWASVYVPVRTFTYHHHATQATASRGLAIAVRPRHAVPGAAPPRAGGDSDGGSAAALKAASVEPGTGDLRPVGAAAGRVHGVEPLGEEAVELGPARP